MKVVLENLTKIFPSRNKRAGEEVVAVNNFNFEIPDGQLVGLLGPSGCGKSTTLYMICGLQKPSSGKLYFGEDDVTELEPEHRGVGLVFQNYALYPHMTVKQNILFPLQNLKGEDKLTKDEMLKRAYNVAKLVQIDELMERKPSELSGGQQQRVAIARALVKMPRVLLLDEPLSNLDARLRLQTREEIRRIQRETQITTVFVTHDQEEAMSISDYIVVMKLGVVQQIGKPQDVYDSPANLFVAKFLGTPPINVFNGYIKDEKVYIGDDCVLDAKGIADQEIYIGIRPEGFELDDNGSLHCDLSSIEVMGRDVSIVSTNANAVSAQIRSIIPADSDIDSSAKTVTFSIKPHKIFLFAKQKVDWTIDAEGSVQYKWFKHKQLLALEVDGKKFDIGTLKEHTPVEGEDAPAVVEEVVEEVVEDDVPKQENYFERKFNEIKNSLITKFGKIKALFTKPMLLAEDKEYDLIVGHTLKGRPLYFTGHLANGGLATSINEAKSVRVHIESVATEVEGENEYRVFFLDGEEKRYINLAVSNAENHEKRIYLEGEEPTGPQPTEVQPEAQLEETVVEE